jgi:ricin-type beta-trefoil lectin protein/putative Ig domain-containing protein
MPAAMGGFRRFGVAAATLLLCSGLTVTAATTASAATGARVPGEHAAGTKAPTTHRTTGNSAKSGPAASPDISTRAGARAASTPAGYSPADLQSAYNLTSASASGGKDAVVAIIGAYDDPNAESDLAAYRSQYGLPPCTTANGCFSKVNENGQASPLPPTAPEASTAEAESMDMDMVSAICPNCHILLVEASSGVFTDMGSAVDSAVTLGARYVIVGWITGSPTPSSPINQDFDHPGVVITAPAGDKGFENYGPATTQYVYPASLPYVTAVGGTTLSPAPGTSRGWSEAVWGPPTNLNGDVGTGSGCAKWVGKPSWQSDTGCAGRTDNDVAAVASNVSFYDTAAGDNGWYDGTGTTLSAAIISAVYALAGTPAANTFPVTYPYLNSADLYSVTSGSNGLNGSCPQPAYLCSGGSGYNGPAGWGTPDGTAAFTSGDSGQVAIVGPSALDAGATTVPDTVNLPIQALDSAGNTLTYSATGLPEGVSIDPSTGVISGILTHDYNGTSTITATDSAGASASISLPWDVENYLFLTSPGAQQTEPGAAVTLNIKSNDADPNATKTFSATGLPPGLTINSFTGVISGTTSSTIGSYDVTVSATDSDGTTTSTSFTWNVWNKITVTAPSFEQSYVGTPVSLTVSATDSASGNTLSYSASELPPGLSINSSTGVISGTPTNLGYWYTSVTVTDGTGSSGTAAFEWMLGGVITLGGLSTQRSVAGQAVALSFAMHDSSSDDIVKYQANGLPPGLNLSATTPLITGWPTTAGTYHVTIEASGDYNGYASASFTWTVTAAADSGPTGPVRLNMDDKCLDDTGNSSANGTKIQTWTCNGGASQDWTYAEDGTLRIHGKCLDVIGRSTAANAKLDLWACNGGTNQQWDIDTGAQLRGLASGYCLTDPASSTSNGTQLEITGCGGYSLREWTLPAGPVLSAVAGKCLDDTGDSTANGTKIEVWTCNGGAAQNWTFEPDGTIRVAGKCLDDTGNGTTSGTKIQLWACNGGAAQQWTAQGSNDSLGVELEHGSLCATPTSMNAANGTQLVLGACGTDESGWHAV